MSNIWKAWAEEELKAYADLKEWLQSVPDQIEMIDTGMEGISSVSLTGTHGCGNSRSRDERYAAAIDRKDELMKRAEATRRRLCCIDRALSILDADDQEIMNRFYLHPEKGAADRLSSDMGVDIKTVYRWKADAIDQVTMALFGRAY